MLSFFLPLALLFSLASLPASQAASTVSTTSGVTYSCPDSYTATDAFMTYCPASAGSYPLTLKSVSDTNGGPANNYQSTSGSSLKLVCKYTSGYSSSTCTYNVGSGSNFALSASYAGQGSSQAKCPVLSTTPKPQTSSRTDFKKRQTSFAQRVPAYDCFQQTASGSSYGSSTSAQLQSNGADTYTCGITGSVSQTCNYDSSGRVVVSNSYGGGGSYGGGSYGGGSSSSSSSCPTQLCPAQAYSGSPNTRRWLHPAIEARQASSDRVRLGLKKHMRDFRLKAQGKDIDEINRE